MTSKMRTLAGLAISLCITTAVAYPSGPPVKHYNARELCRTMSPEPGHNHPSQKNEDSPYKITISEDSYTYGKPIQVNISGKTTGHTFKGFFLQARRVNKKIPLGMFSHFSPGTQGLDCDPGNHTAWGHSDATHKEVATATWNPPHWDQGDVQFRATVVQGPNILYWLDVKSDPIIYMGPSRPPTTMESGQDINQASILLATIMTILTAVVIGRN